LIVTGSLQRAVDINRYNSMAYKLYPEKAAVYRCQSLYFKIVTAVALE
jgi:hypothetical protein